MEPYQRRREDRADYVDEAGPIPTFPPLSWDESGKFILPGEEEMRARREAGKRLRKLSEKWDAESVEVEPNEDQWREFLTRLGVRMGPAPSREGE